MRDRLFSETVAKKLRAICAEQYGEEFAELFDKLNSGEPIGSAEFTIEFCRKIEFARKKAGYNPVLVKVKLDPGSTMPTKGYPTDAGWDLYAKEDFTVPAGGSAVHDTGVHMAIPEGYCGLLVSKSGLNVKHSLTSTGLVDSLYSGPIVVKIYNHDKGRDYEFKVGEKITQVVVLPIPKVQLEIVSELEDSERGSSGFGSTGK